MLGSVICVSGGFDPLHVGHVRLLESAAIFGEVVVILNSDRWLRARKGYCLMNWPDRKAVLESIRWVSRVEPVDDRDGTVCEALIRLRPKIFGNGGKRGLEDTPERTVCHENNIVLLWGLGGGAREQHTLRIREMIAAIGTPEFETYEDI